MYNYNDHIMQDSSTLNPIEKHKNEIEKRISQLEQKFRDVVLFVARRKLPETTVRSSETAFRMRIRTASRTPEQPRPSTSGGR